MVSLQAFGKNALLSTIQPTYTFDMFQKSRKLRICRWVLQEVVDVLGKIVFRQRDAVIASIGRGIVSCPMDIGYVALFVRHV